MAEVSGEDDFLSRPLLARDRRGDDVVGRGHHAGAYPRVQHDLLSGRETVPKVLRLPRREHECERVSRLVGRQVAPPHQVAVVAGPRGALVRVVRQEPGGSPLLDGPAMNERQRAAREHEPAPYGLPGVVGGCRPAADVHQLGGDVRVLAVVGEGHRQVGEAGDGASVRRHLLQRRLRRVPAEVAAEVRIASRAVGREALDRGIGEARRDESFPHHLRGRGEARRAVDAVETAQVPYRPQGGPAVYLAVDRIRHRLRPERHHPILGATRNRGTGDEPQSQQLLHPPSLHRASPATRMESISRRGRSCHCRQGA